jgi:hypothetical protein
VPVAALAAGIVYLLGYLFITPAPMDAAMSSHNISSMLTKLWENGGKLALFLVAGVGVMAFRKKPYAGWVIGALLCYVAFYFFKPYQWYNTHLTYLLSALCLVIALQLSIINYQLSIIIGAIILMIATLGTDTAWLKLFPAVLCLLPVAVTLYQSAERRYLFTVMAIFAIAVTVRMTTNSVGQSNLTQAITFSSVAPYRHIAIRPAEEERLTQYLTDYQSINPSIHHSINPSFNFSTSVRPFLLPIR